MPCNVDGSIIVLFGDFGNGWFTSGYEFGSESGGDRDSGLWGHLRVGDVIKDMDYLGVESVAKFSNQDHIKPMKFQINGFGKEIQSIKGGVLTRGDRNQAIKFRDIRNLASRRIGISQEGEIEVQIDISRVPAMFGAGSNSSNGVSISNEDVCTVAYKTVSDGGANEYDLFYIFSAVEVKDDKVSNGVLQGKRVGGRAWICNRINELYKGTTKTSNEKVITRLARKDGLIHLHQRFVDSDKKRLVYIIGKQENIYLWPSDGGHKAIALSGIIWSGKNYNEKGPEKNKCQQEPAKTRVGCYAREYGHAVHKHLGWSGVKGTDFAALSIRSIPGEVNREIDINRDLSHSGKCSGHRVCINHPWTRKEKGKQILKKISR